MSRTPTDTPAGSIRADAGRWRHRVLADPRIGRRASASGVRDHGNARPSGHSGFVLIAVLVLLVVLSLLAGTVALVAQRAVAEAREDDEIFRGELDVLSSRDTLLFMLATQRVTLAGLTVDDAANTTMVPVDEDIEGLSIMPVGNEIRPDGSTYGGYGHAHFQLQDARGLINPNFAPPAVRTALFQSLGTRVEDQGALDATRLDYQDPDDLVRIGGAEAPQYRQAGMAPPTNRAVTTPLEYRRMLGWRDLLAPYSDDHLLRMLTADRTFVLNINSAPADVLTLFPGIDRDAADRIVALRRVRPFTSTAQVRQALPMAFDDGEFLTYFSGSAGNLVVWDSRGGPRRLFHWTLTPYHDGGRPWRIDYEVTLPRGNTSDPGVVAPPAAPLFSGEDPRRS